MSETKYTILKKGQKLRAYRINLTLSIETQIFSLVNLEEDLKIEFRQLGSETGLTIYVKSTLILVYCNRFEILEAEYEHNPNNL